MKYLEKIQTLLPLGYLYLILLGLIKQSIVYYQVGVPILSYSSISDILISPISEISSNPIMIIPITAFLFLIFGIQIFIVKKRRINLIQKILGPDRINQDTNKRELLKATFPFFVLLFAFELLSIFIGIGLSEGGKISKHMTNGNFTYNYKLNFNSGKAEDVYVFDLNSSYCFYLTKGSKNIKIVPFATISNLELINNKKLK